MGRTTLGLHPFEGDKKGASLDVHPEVQTGESLNLCSHATYGPYARVIPGRSENLCAPEISGREFSYVQLFCPALGSAKKGNRQDQGSLLRPLAIVHQDSRILCGAQCSN